MRIYKCASFLGEDMKIFLLNDGLAIKIFLLNNTLIPKLTIDVQ